jgi:hypothetical protein
MTSTIRRCSVNLDDRSLMQVRKLAESKIISMSAVIRMLLDEAYRKEHPTETTT